MSTRDLLRVSQSEFEEEFPAEPAMIKVSVGGRRRRVIEDSDDESNESFRRHPSLRRTDTQSTIPLPDSPFSELPPSAFERPEPAQSVDEYVPDAAMLSISEVVKPTAEVQAVVFTHFMHAVGQKPCASSSSSSAECHSYPLGSADGMTFIKTQRAENNFKGGGYEVEVSPTTGRSHIQGWFVLEKPIAMVTLRKYFADRGCNITFFAKMRGTVAESIKYCSKDGRYVAWRDQDCVNPHARAGQGARNDIATFVEACANGASMRQIIIDYPEMVLRHPRGVQTIRENIFVDPRLAKGVRLPRSNVIFYGPSGTGKSTAANFYIGDRSVYVPGSNNLSIISFETYDGQEVLKIEEFSGPRMGVNTLKDIAGDDACQLSGRGCSKPGLHNSIVVTSNYNPAGWYPASPVDFVAIQRRFTIYHCGEKTWTKSWLDKDTMLHQELQFPNPLIAYKNGSWANERGQWVLP